MTDSAPSLTANPAATVAAALLLAQHLIYELETAGVLDRDKVAKVYADAQREVSQLPAGSSGGEIVQTATAILGWMECHAPRP